MEETFEEYLQRLKDRRTEDDYKYTDEDFEKYERYIRDCCKNGMSVYKCLELMYFAEKDMDDQLFNREPKQTDWKDSTKAMMEAYGDNPKDFPYEETKHETLEEAAKNYIYKPQNSDYGDYSSFIAGAKWQQERMYSEEEVKDMVSKTVEEFCVHLKDSFRKAVTVEWFEQIKKK